MTGPIRPDAELVAKLTVDSSDVPSEVKDALDRASRNNDAELKRTGREMGDAIGEGIGEELESQGPELVAAVGRGLEGHKMKVTKETFQFDGEGNVTKRWVTTLADGFDREVRSGEGRRAFGAVGEAISSAIGSGFNVSGRSSLIFLLIPLLGIIAELIGALVIAAGALVAYLYLIPSAIGAIILQVGVLFAAFQGVGTAIQGAFEAKNADELKKALEGLTPAAREFIKSLLPLRDLFKTFRDAAQEAFFRGFGGAISELVEGLKRIGTGPIAAVAGALGNLAGTVVKFLDAPSFQRFFQELIPATVRWINGFTPALLDFLTGLANFGHTIMPFFEEFGATLNGIISDIGYWLTGLHYDPEFQQFLTDAKDTMKDFGDALGAAVGFLKTFWQTLKAAGGDTFLTDLTYFFDQLTLFFESEIGLKSLEGLIHGIQFLAFVFFNLLIGTLAAFALIEVVLEWIKNQLVPWLNKAGESIRTGILDALSAVGAFLEWLFGTAVPWALGLFHNTVDTIVRGIGSAIGWVIGQIISLVARIVFWVIDAGNSVGNFFTVTLPNRIRGAFNTAVNILFDAGRNILQGLINGIQSMFPNLGNVMSGAMNLIRRFTPFSPAKEGPLSGSGDPMISGQKIVQRLAAGIEMEAPILQSATAGAMNNIVFGAGAVQVGFNGALPTTEQARTTGAAAGQGLAAQLTRLGVRTL